MNKAILLGNLGKDPQVRTLDSGKKVASFSLATTEKIKGEKYTDWHNVTLWGGLAEVAEKYLHKGDRVLVEGRIKYREHEGKYYTEIVAQSMKMLNGGSVEHDQGVANDDMAQDIPF